MSKIEKKFKFKKWMLFVIIVAILLVVGIAYIVTAGIKAMKQMESASSEDDNLFTVEKQDVKSEITTSGTVIGLDQISYTSPVSAKVEDIKVKVGQTVNAGEMLLTYNAKELGDDLYKVQLQAKSEKAAGSASYEAAGQAAAKAAKAREKIATLKAEASVLQNQIGELNAIVTIYESEHPNANNGPTGTGNDGQSSSDATDAENGDSENPEENPEPSEPTPAPTPSVDYATYSNALAQLSVLTEQLAEKNGEIASQQAIIDAADDAKVLGSAATQISVANQLADMSVNAAQESLDAAEAGIVALKKGIVASIDITKGAFAQETQTVMTIINSDDIGIEFVISKDNLGVIKPGQKARIVVGGNEYNGEVDYVSRVATADAVFGNSSGDATIKGRIKLDDPDDTIFLGVNAKVYLFIGEAKDSLVIPYEALCTDIDGDYVYVVNKEELIERKDVKVGLASDEYYEILEGLEAGDRVILSVTKDMKPGDQYVKPTPAIPGM